MCLDADRLEVVLNALSFADLSDVQTVGIGLYLALAVVQVVTESGIAGLRRRAGTLRAAVNESKVASEYANMHSLHQEIGLLEIGLRGFNRTLLIIVSVLFAIALSYFGYCVVFQDLKAGVAGVVFTVGFYLVLPVLIFILAGLHVGRKCAKVSREVRDAEARYQRKVLG